MKLGSLFNGIGTFPLSGLQHGIIPVWASEIEAFPIKVTKHHFPDMKHLGDVTKINGAEIEPVDIVTFGSPCQDLSVAGKREGLAGERSGLFMDAVRIIREMRRASDGHYPRFAVWENVPGAYSSNKGQDFRAVLEEIAEAEIPMPPSGKWATAGMVRTERVDVAWRTLDAQHWGVPQRRKRIFLVADFGGQCAGEILFEQQGVSGHLAESGKKGQETPSGSAAGARGPSYAFISGQSAQARSLGFAEEVTPVLKADAGGNTVPAVLTESRKAREEVAGDAGNGTKATVFNESGPGWISEGFGCLRCEGENRPSRPTHTVLIGFDNQTGQSEGIEVSPAIRSESHGTLPYVAKGFQMLAFGEYVSDKNASTVKARDAKDATDLIIEPLMPANSVDCRNLCENKELSGTIQSKTGGGYSLNYQNPVRIGYAVRRLIPLECERLQGLPDNWTNIEGASDTARYKAIGNGIAKPCSDFVIGRIAEVLRRAASRRRSAANARIAEQASE